MDFVSCPLEQERGNGGIDASGEAYEDFHGVRFRIRSTIAGISSQPETRTAVSGIS
jgi:hypothetical protein